MGNNKMLHFTKHCLLELRYTSMNLASGNTLVKNYILLYSPDELHHCIMLVPFHLNNLLHLCVYVAYSKLREKAIAFSVFLIPIFIIHFLRQDILENDSIELDELFKYSLMYDIVKVRFWRDNRKLMKKKFKAIQTRYEMSLISSSIERDQHFSHKHNNLAQGFSSVTDAGVWWICVRARVTSGALQL